MKKSENKKVAIYTRVSTEDQAKEGYSLDAQKKKLEEYAEFKKWWVYKIYEDAGISGKSVKGRKSFQEMLKDAKDGKFSAILIYKFDRAFRNVKEALITFDELKEINVDFVSISEEIDTTTAMGKFFFVIISGFAELERGLTQDRMKLIMKEKFSEGINIGRCPIGYIWNKKKKVMVINEKKAEVVRELYNLHSNGKSITDLTKMFNMGYQGVKNILKNKVYIGIISFEGVEKTGIHSPIISKELWEKVNHSTF